MGTLKIFSLSPAVTGALPFIGAAVAVGIAMIVLINLLNLLADRRGRRVAGGTLPADAADAGDDMPPLRLPEEDPLTVAVRGVEAGELAWAEREVRDLYRKAEQGGSGAERAQASLALGYVVGASGRLAEAEAAYSAALRLEPDLAQACLDLSGRLTRLGNDAAAEVALVAALAVLSSLTDDPAKRFVAHLLYGQLLRRMGRLAHAERELRDALRLRPEDPAALTQHGAVLQALGRSREATLAYEAALRVAPENPLAHAYLGSLLLREGLHDEAERHLSLATTLSPEQPTARINLAELHVRRGRWKAARDEASAALRARPEAAGAHLNLAQANLHLGDLAEAERHAREGAALLPESGRAAYVLGRVLLAQRRDDEAAAQFRQALLLEPELPAQLRAEADAATGVQASVADELRAGADALERARVAARAGERER